MGGIALLARALGHEISGSDLHVYPPMSTQLQAQGIEIMDGYDPSHLHPAPDLVIVGNAMSRGYPIVETMLNDNIPYISGPQWLSENVLRDRYVLAVSGTHGKTTISTMLCWIFESAGLSPGFLVGGVPQNFGVSARLGETGYFIIEADEYDTAFFDKRSKFVHYHPNTLIINNIEYDHADIFPDIDSVIRQFHHVVRTVPGNGKIICKAQDEHIATALKMGCWSAVEYFAGDPAQDETPWQVAPLADDFSQFHVLHGGESIAKVEWDLFGQFNAENALAAIAAADHAGIQPVQACEAMRRLKNAKRRLELLACVRQISVYDDFAHHPTAILVVLKALRKKANKQRIIAIMEPRSNTMRQGVHMETLADAFVDADHVYLYDSGELSWDITEATRSLGARVDVMHCIDQMVSTVAELAVPGDYILIMSNGGFAGLQQKLIGRLALACSVSKDTPSAT